MCSFSDRSKEDGCCWTIAFLVLDGGIKWVSLCMHESVPEATLGDNAPNHQRQMLIAYCTHLPVTPVTPSSRTLSSVLPLDLLAAAATALTGCAIACMHGVLCAAGAGDLPVLMPAAALPDPGSSDCISTTDRHERWKLDKGSTRLQCSSCKL